MLKNSFIAILTICFSLAGNSQSEWKYTGPDEMTLQVKGMIKSLWTEEGNLNYVLAGSACGGLFKTENALSNKPVWLNISDTYNGMTFGVTDIAVKSNSQNQVIYISTASKSAVSKGYGNGILKTVNGGKSWQAIGPRGENEITFAFDGMVMNKENEDEMIAYTSHEVFITRDDWKTFDTVKLGIDKNNGNVSFCDADFAPYEPGKFYICTRTNNVTDAKLFVCENYGARVNEMAPKDVAAERIEVTTVNDKKYKGKFYTASGTGSIYLNYFNGKSFSPVLNKLPVTQFFAGAYWNFELSVNQTDTNIIYLSMTETSRSTDGGKTFQKISYYNGPNTHADNRAQLLAKSTVGGEDDVLLLGNDGGVSLADKYNPLNWKNLNGSGLNANQFYGVSVAQSDTLLVAGGTADNGGFIIAEKNSTCTIGSCGDGYMAAVLDINSVIIECNTPSVLYHNLKKGGAMHLLVSDTRYDGKRPMLVQDSFVYVGYSNVWRISKRELENGNSVFKKISNIPDVLNESGGIKNGTMKSLAIGELNSGALSYSQPNWGNKDNNGKFYYCENLNKNNWIDITNLAIYKDFAICQWSDICAIEMDNLFENRFYFVSKDVSNQSNCRIFEMEVYLDSNKCAIKEIGTGLPKIGINDINIDKYSNVMYLACDDGVYYTEMYTDSIIWKKLQGIEKKLPAVMVFDIDFNYVTNTLFAATFARGVWQTQLISTGKNHVKMGKNLLQDKILKVDGRLVIDRKNTYTISTKIILTKNAKIELRKGSRLIVKNKNVVRDENNQVADINNYLIKHKTARVIVD